MNETVLNPDLTSGTMINDEVHDERTGYTANNITEINTAVEQGVTLKSGSIILQNYVIIAKLNTKSGEADLYLCKQQNKPYMAKVYRRKLAVKKDIEEKLLRISSPFVANVVAAGNYQGYPVEIIPVYRHGTLQGKKFSFLELKEHIIPCLNEGLHAIHAEGIIHKDIKPSNIVLNDNMKDVSIIDFGISSVTEDGSTVVVTDTSMTPEYAAPETFRGLFLNESDYYSLGITIYELFSGRTPLEGLSGEDVERCITLHKLPYPVEMPDELVVLISALTYTDITHRKNKENPNRRWGYEEVRNWCNGISQVLPGEGVGNIKSGIATYRFLGNDYTQKNDLVEALACNWDKGKKELFRGILSSFFESTSPGIAAICRDAERRVENGENDDLVFFDTIYRLNEQCEAIYWKDNSYVSVQEIGEKLLSLLRNGDYEHLNDITDILENCVLSRYCKNIAAEEKFVLKLEEIEDAYNLNSQDEKYIDRLLYEMAYILSGAKTYQYNGNVFTTVDELAGYMCGLLTKSYSEYSSFCLMLMDEDGVLEPQFECWLKSIDKQKEMKLWKNRFNRR